MLRGTVLLGDLAERLEVTTALVDTGKRMDKRYILTRYPNSFDSGAPTDYYTDAEAEPAIADAEQHTGCCPVALGCRQVRRPGRRGVRVVDSSPPPRRVPYPVVRVLGVRHRHALE